MKSKAPRNRPKNARHWKTGDELRALLAERARMPASRVAVYGHPGKWDASLIVNQAGNAERKAKKVASGGAASS